MKYGIDLFGDKLEPNPSAVAWCPICDEILVPKCGDIKVWHWSHKSNSECDPWSEGETEWHRRWKAGLRPQFQEVRIGNHRADIVGNKGIVIELQHSPISPNEIQEREMFYKNMVWVFDARDFEKNLNFRSKVGQYGEYSSFRWKWPRESHDCISKRLFWDFGEELFEVKKISWMMMNNRKYWGGWGIFVGYDWFCEEFLCDVIDNRKQP